MKAKELIQPQKPQAKDRLPLLGCSALPSCKGIQKCTSSGSIQSSTQPFPSPPLPGTYQFFCGFAFILFLRSWWFNLFQGVRYRTVIWLVDFYFSNSEPLQYLLKLRFSLPQSPSLLKKGGEDANWPGSTILMATE